jgi:hypothetical protein
MEEIAIIIDEEDITHTDLIRVGAHLGLSIAEE